jgi:hypothetical protein
MPIWLTAILAAVQEAPTIINSLETLFQGVHNEMTGGTGMTNPAAVTQALSSNAGAVAAAVVANTAHAAENIGSAVGGTTGQVISEAGQVADTLSTVVSDVEKSL